jgi:chemotaxis protein MotB
MRTLLVTTLSVVFLAACGVEKEKYMAKELEAQKYQKLYADESATSADLAKKAADLEAKLAATRQQLDQMARSKAQLEQEKGELAQKSAQYEQLAGSLKDQIAAGQVEISELRGKMTVKLKDKILFASGSAALGKEGRAALDAVADAFRNLKGKNVVVAGYTDDVPTGRKGPYRDNWDLSAARAIAVVRYLQEKDVPSEMLGAAGWSEYRPLAPNDTPEGRSQNRRIEINLTAADYAPPVVEAPK